MPLPDDQRVVALADELLKTFDQIFGLHPGFRPAHARGVMLNGIFTPSRRAGLLTNAGHALRARTPVMVRFSNSTGLPLLPDNVPGANPRGLAIRFHLAEHVHTDLIAHSTDGFPARDGHEFLEFLKAIAASGPEAPSPKPVEIFLGAHPAAQAFVQGSQAQPVSFARLNYFGISAFQFKNVKGVTTFGRYRIVPDEGSAFLTEEAVRALPETYLFDELTNRMKSGPIRLKILIQLAAPGDPLDDATVHWPEERPLLDFGALELTSFVPNNLKEQQHIIFDPIPRVEGIEATADPLFELRAAIYLLSGRRRRAATAES